MTSKQKTLRWIFWGTDEFATKILTELKQRDIIPTFIVTTPDKPKGRKLVLTASAVKGWAIQNNIPYAEPAKLKEVPSFMDEDWDLFVVASYGKIIPDFYLDKPRHKTLNIHPSLLPKYRGATPLESAILSGDNKTGVSLMQIDAEMDHGPILAQTEINLKSWAPSYEELRDRSAEIGAQLLADNLSDWILGKLKATDQNHNLATYTKKITKDDGLVDLEKDNPELIFRKVRAFTPWPGVYFFIKRDGEIFALSSSKLIWQMTN